jgi:hypothetical protein
MAVHVKARLPYAWGATADEANASYPCDARLDDADEGLLRAVAVDAPAATVFRWLCQLRVAPYSYDWLDNAGRRSPVQLSPGLEELAVGQRFMTIFTLVDFARDRHITLEIKHPRSVAIFGAIVVSYVIVPEGPERCRLVVKLAVRRPRRLPASLVSRLLPWGDLVMMRKQLLTLKRYAERS